MMKKPEFLKDLNYQLGKLVGEIIYEKYLPTLNIDSLKTKHVIDINDSSMVEKLKRLGDEWFNERDEDKRDKLFNEINNIRDEQKKIHLPETIECSIERIEPQNMKLFKMGIDHYLWQTDLSHYSLDDDFWVPTESFAWCSIIKIKRTDLVKNPSKIFY